MKLHIRRGEKTRGTFRKETLYFVEARIELTDEERVAVERANIGKRILMTTCQEEPIGKSNLTIRYFLEHGEVLSSADLLQVNQWESEIKEACRNFKATVEEIMSDGGDREEVIDL